jgi:hypothetical protein
MLAKLRKALWRRQKAARVAEALVWQRGAQGIDMIRHAAMDHHQSEEQRGFWSLAERIARRRLAQIDDLDLPAKEAVGDRWSRRRGSLIR